ncbi:hypothetical protein CIPAW_01G103700 [Carya illinoinensis]|uniref:Uncharacterized protein n=1 Tax=Carya illinoinensis TaxID=32201 RepID=A0A8T1RMD0_CARIL|nr:hypothetical protein CIPAW_01G103700 [Carya illinoinensis]
MGSLQANIFRPIISPALREAKARQFLDLVRETMIVECYAATFVALSHFANYLIPDETRKARNFEQGLHLRIRNRHIPLKIRNFTDLVSRATLVEEDMRMNTELFNQKKRQQTLQEPNCNKKPTPNDRPRPSYNSQYYVVCKTYGRMHPRNYLRGRMLASNVGEPNHMAQDCLKKNALVLAEESGQRAIAPARVFAHPTDDVVASDNLCEDGAAGQDLNQRE